MNISEYEKIIEAVLFAAGEAVSIRSLCKALELDEATVRNLLRHISDTFEADKRGILIKELEDAYQLCTNPLYFEHIIKTVKAAPKKRLTPPLMETLSIIAYKQPMTKAQIEDIRGVNADHAVNKLIEYGLVCENGRQDSPGKPILFGTSQEFLRHFGLSSLHELPLLQTNIEELREETEKELDM